MQRVPSARVLAGLALGFAGVALLTVGAHASATHGTVSDAQARDAAGLIDRGLLLLSTLGWAAGSIVARDSDHPSR
jgi:drug/metabolite transporter (DMT)-like permease